MLVAGRTVVCFGSGNGNQSVGLPVRLVPQHCVCSTSCGVSPAVGEEDL